MRVARSGSSQDEPPALPSHPNNHLHTPSRARIRTSRLAALLADTDDSNSQASPTTSSRTLDDEIDAYLADKAPAGTTSIAYWQVCSGFLLVSLSLLMIIHRKISSATQHSFLQHLTISQFKGQQCPANEFSLLQRRPRPTAATTLKNNWWKCCKCSSSRSSTVMVSISLQVPHLRILKRIS